MKKIDVKVLLQRAVCQLEPAKTERTPWLYGWSIEEYRRSSEAALSSAGGLVTLDPAGLTDFETAMRQLISEPAIKRRWDPSYLWGDVAALLVHASESDDPAEVIATELERLRTCGEALVMVPIANVSWDADPVPLADGVVGVLDDRLMAAVDTLANGRTDSSANAARTWVDEVRKRHEGPGDLVVLVTWTDEQASRAREVAEQRVIDLCSLALLFEPNPGAHEMWSLRGDANRPGVRGLTSDRRALEHLLESHPAGQLELFSEPLVLDDRGDRRRMRNWYSVSPVPLAALVQNNCPGSIDRCIRSCDSIPSRLRVAARWYSEAHWAADAHDAALALGVALDAMVGAREGLPGQVLATRFAYLDPDVKQRRSRVARWNDIYRVRSAVAHGGTSSRLADATFLREIASEVVWTSHRLLVLDDRFAPVAEKNFEDAMTRLRLGESTW